MLARPLVGVFEKLKQRTTIVRESNLPRRRNDTVERWRVEPPQVFQAIDAFELAPGLLSIPPAVLDQRKEPLAILMRDHERLLEFLSR